MRVRAKAPSATTAARPASTRRARGLFGLACLCVLALAAFLGSGAPSAGATEACPNEAIRAEQHSAFLPDCRAYELVSPQDKNGGDVMADSSRTRASASGDAVQFSSLLAFANPQGTGIASEYIAVRDRAAGTQGWATHGITASQEPLSIFDLVFGPLEPRYMGELSPDLSKGVFLAKSSITPGSPNVDAVSKLYVRDDLLSPGTGHYQLVSDCLSPPAGPCASPFTGADGDPSHQPTLTGTSADFQHVAFESSLNLTNDASGALPKLYEWDQGTLRLAGVVPPPGATECGPAPLDPCQAAESSAAGQGGNPVIGGGLGPRYTRNTISSDGSRTAFTSPVDEHSAGTPESNLYLRENHTNTVQLNASERTDCAGDPTCGGDGIADPAPAAPGPAVFQAATPDLSKIYFTSGAPLTDDPDGGLYVYDASKPASDPHNLSLIASSVLGVIGVSQTGDYVYFASDTQLIPGDPTGCDFASPCIFVWHDGILHEVARINHGTEVDTILGVVPWSDNAQRARLTPDGTRLVFVSEGTADEQPPYDHGSACQGPNGVLPYFDGSTPACAEVYLYDATADGGAGKLSCVSCNPSGTHTSATDADFNVWFGGASRASHLNHAVSDDGRYVFFQTGESLVPRDTNGAYDVYRYDSQSDEVSLISSGTSPLPSFFLDASADGSDVFFRTADRLLGWDRDTQADLYDARIGGGLPEPPPMPAPCQGETCHSSQPPAPPATTPGTASLLGANPKPRCRRGKVRRHGRCVKAHHKSHRSKRIANHERRAGR